MSLKKNYQVPPTGGEAKVIPWVLWVWLVLSITCIETEMESLTVFIETANNLRQ